MGEEYVTVGVCNERKCTMDERFARDKASIADLEDNMATLTKLVTELATLQKTSASTQAEHEKRIRTLEQAPAGKWDKLTTTIITAIASGLVGYALSAVVR